VTTRKQIRELAAPLLARNPDLVLEKDVILIRPIRHLFHFILIERTGNADTCDPRCATVLMFQRLNYFPIGMSRLIYRPGPCGLWSWSDPTMIESFLQTAENEVLPKLRAIRTLEDYYYTVPSHDPRQLIYDWFKLLLSSLALGWLDQARSLLEQNPRVLGNEWGVEYVQWLDEREAGLGTRLLECGDGLGRDDRLRIAGYLHASEELSVRNLGLGKYWERTEFPIETNLPCD